MRKVTKLLTLVVALLCLSAPAALAGVTHRAGSRGVTAHRHAGRVRSSRARITHVVVRTTRASRAARSHRRTHTKAQPAPGVRASTGSSPASTSPVSTGSSSTGSTSTGSSSGSGSTSSGSGSGTTTTSGGPFFDGTFTSPDEWPSTYGSCSQALSNTSVQFDITPACDPAANGHYRTDLCSSASCNGNGTVAAGDVYQAGQATCTSVPIDAVNVPTVSTSGWMMFAEAKNNSAVTAGWAFMLNSYYTGVNQFAISFGTGINNTTWDGTMTPGWHTLSICTNNANDSSGEVYGIYEDGVRLTFNHGSGAGQQSLTGFPIIDNGMSSWPLDIDDYTGGAPSNQIITGAPLISSGTDNPPMPAGGWNNA